MKTVRFLANFIITTVITEVDAAGVMQVSEANTHVQMFNVYSLDNYEINGNAATLYFAKNSGIKGIAPHVELGYCEFRDPEADKANNIANPPKSGCGGCGKR